MGNQFKSFVESKAADKLTQLAANPYDLTQPGALEADNRLSRYICKTEYFNLHYGMQRLDDKVLDALQEMAQELCLVEQFRAMRRGAVINEISGYESEKRQVLHTACRDVFSGDPAEPLASLAAKNELKKLKRFLDQLAVGEICNNQGEKFDTLLQIGIGGSDLGPRAIYEALQAYRLPGRRVLSVANVDPDDVAGVLEEVDLSRTIVNIVSKSGSTLETMTNEQLVRDAFLAEGLEPTNHCIAVTGVASPMEASGRYLRTFSMFDYIGGRYSVCSMVGAVMLGFALGMELLEEFLQGAAGVDLLAEENDLKKNLPLLLAVLGVWNRNFLDHPTLAVLPYSQALHRFPAHLQQCDMESNGKSFDRSGELVSYKTGPVIWGEPGTNGQHAFYQLLHQGTEVVPVEFIGFRKPQRGRDIVFNGTTSQEKLVANLLAQMVSLATGKVDDNPNRTFTGNRQSLLLFAEKLTPRAMGALLAIYEAKIVFQGFIWNINSFDQEGVQLGKVLASRFLGAMEQGAESDTTLEAHLLNLL